MIPSQRLAPNIFVVLPLATPCCPRLALPALASWPRCPSLTVPDSLAWPYQPSLAILASPSRTSSSQASPCWASTSRTSHHNPHHPGVIIPASSSLPRRPGLAVPASPSRPQLTGLGLLASASPALLPAKPDEDGGVCRQFERPKMALQLMRLPTSKSRTKTSSQLCRAHSQRLSQMLGHGQR